MKDKLMTKIEDLIKLNLPKSKFKIVILKYIHFILNFSNVINKIKTKETQNYNLLKIEKKMIKTY